MPIKNIIFDMGDVLVKIQPSLTLDAFCKIGAKRESVETVFDEKEIFIQYHKGKISSKEFRCTLKQKLQLSHISDEEFDQAWLTSITEPKVPSLDFIERLTFIKRLKFKGYKIFLLSNNNEIHYVNTIKWYGHLLNECIPVENQYYSHQVGHVKPEREIFEYVLNKNHLNPRETIFFDDILEYINAAKCIGLHAMQFTRVEPMLKIMEKINSIHLQEAIENKMVTSNPFSHSSQASEFIIHAKTDKKEEKPFAWNKKTIFMGACIGLAGLYVGGRFFSKAHASLLSTATDAAMARRLF